MKGEIMAFNKFNLTKTYTSTTIQHMKGTELIKA